MQAGFPLILVVDDDENIRRTLRFNLDADGYRVRTAVTGQEALNLLSKELPDLGIIDLILPDMHGFELARRIKVYFDIPLIFLTAVGAENTIIDGLDLYAEDYVVKPFSYPQLLARVGRVIKRTRHLLPDTSTVRLDERLTIDIARKCAVVDGKQVALTPIECRLIWYLATRIGRIASSSAIIDTIWDDDDGDAQRLWVHIRNLRQKIEKDPTNPKYLVTCRGEGYKLCLASKQEK